MRLTIALTALVCLLASVAAAEPSIYADSLRGHGSVTLTVELHEDAPKLGLYKKTITAFTVSHLKKGDVDVRLFSAEAAKADDLVLTVQVDLLQVSGLYVFHLPVKAYQMVVPLHSREIVMASTWESGQFGAAIPGESKVIREALTKTLDSFIEDWKAAHEPRADVFEEEVSAADQQQD